MRLNALIIVALAFALLSPGQVVLAASHTSHRTAARKAAAASSRKKAPAEAAKAKPVAATSKSPARAKKARAAQPRLQPAVATRSRRGLRHGGATLQRTSLDTTTSHRRATSQDFLRAASVSDNPARSVPHGQQPAPRLSTSHVTDSVAAPVSNATVIPQTASIPASVIQDAMEPVILYNRRGHLIVPPPLRGSHEILVRQNVVADRDGLDRVQDDADLARMTAARQLVRIPESAALNVDDRLESDRRVARPWTVQFLVALSRAHYARFHSQLIVTSAVRTVSFQNHLQHINGNAAPSEGETASPHLTGQAIDIGKKGLSMTEIAWLRGYLLPLSQQGRIDVEEEFQQACFHISVYKKYVNRQPKREIASSSDGTSTLASAIN